MIKIAICESDRLISDQIYGFISSYFNKKMLIYGIESFSYVEELFYFVGETGTFDIIFLGMDKNRGESIDKIRDIMDISPLQILILLLENNHNLECVFKLQPFSCLEKPLNQALFLQVMDRIEMDLAVKVHTIRFYFNRMHYRLRLREILYFESRKRIIKVVCENEQYEYYGKMSEVQYHVDNINGSFVRIHQSFFININYVKRMTRQQVEMTNQHVLPISESRFKMIEDKLVRLSDIVL